MKKFLLVFLVVGVVAVLVMLSSGSVTGIEESLEGLGGLVGMLLGEEEEAPAPFSLLQSRAEVRDALPFDLQKKVFRYLRGGGVFPVGVEGGNLIFPKKNVLTKDEDWENLVWAYQQVYPDRRPSVSADDLLKLAKSEDSNLARGGVVLYPVEALVYGTVARHVELRSAVPIMKEFLVKFQVGDGTDSVRGLFNLFRHWRIKEIGASAKEFDAFIRRKSESAGTPGENLLNLPLKIKVFPWDDRWEVGRVFGGIEEIHSLYDLKGVVDTLKELSLIDEGVETKDVLAKLKDPNLGFFSEIEEPIFPWGIEIKGDTYSFLSADYLLSKRGHVYREVVNGREGWVLRDPLDIFTLFRRSEEVQKLFSGYESIRSYFAKDLAKDRFPVFCWISGEKLNKEPYFPLDPEDRWVSTRFLQFDKKGELIFSPCFLMVVRDVTDLPLFEMGLEKIAKKHDISAHEVKNIVEERGLEYPITALVDNEQELDILGGIPLHWGVEQVVALEDANGIEVAYNELGVSPEEADTFFRSLPNPLPRGGVLIFRLDKEVHTDPFATMPAQVQQE